MVVLRATGPPQPLVGHRMDLTRLEFSPDGQTLASSSVDHTIRLWATASGVCHTVLPGHFEEVSDISFSPDGRSLASLAVGDSVKFWQLPLGRELMRLEDPDWGGNLLFSPDGRTLAVTSDYARPYGPDRRLKLLRAP
jgi:WD40 repeat protein